MKLGRRILWWIPFLVATFALSKVFEASRQLTSESGGEGSLWSLLLWGIVLVVNFLVLGYDSYVKSKAEGKVVHQIWLFEKFRQCCHRERSQ